MDGDSSIQHEFLAIESEIQSGKFFCDICKKTCKNDGGLTHHISAKHRAGKTENKELSPHVFTDESLKFVIRNTLEKIAGNNCLDSSIKKELVSYEYEKSISMMAKERFTEIAKISSKFGRSGNIEKFYSDSYSTICLIATNYFIKLILWRLHLQSLYWFITREKLQE